MSPLGREVVVIAGGILIVKTCVAVCAGLPLSEARTVKVNMPATDGVPLITPTGESGFNPVGSEPEITDQL